MIIMWCVIFRQDGIGLVLRSAPESSKKKADELAKTLGQRHTVLAVVPA
jgi:hypothetical protein